ncbi:MAG: type II toxin-antitoxin system MqsA family antitoxin [Caldilineaceae bacterium]|nr:type II toxin-antitoxin system MqsA family antitoxin [Caldilineaceae bacterium]
MSKAFERIKAGLEDAVEYARGDTKGRRVHQIEVPAVNVRSIRHRTGLTQHEFSAKYGFAVASVRNWEQGRRQPDRSARLLLMVIDKYPNVVEEALIKA